MVRYRKGHYIVEEYVDKVLNKHPPNHPWQASKYFILEIARLSELWWTVRCKLRSTISINKFHLIGSELTPFFLLRRSAFIPPWFYPTVWREPVNAEKQTTSDCASRDKVRFPRCIAVPTWHCCPKKKMLGVGGIMRYRLVVYPAQGGRYGRLLDLPKSKIPVPVNWFVSRPVNSSLKSPESETNSNDIVLVGIGMHALLGRLEEMKISKYFTPFSSAHPLSALSYHSYFYSHPKTCRRYWIKVINSLFSSSFG